MDKNEPMLAARLGMSVHVSPLRFRVLDLYAGSGDRAALCVEDWLVDVANARGARVVCRRESPPEGWRPPDQNQLSNEELITAICQLQCLDRPQMLRLAAQLVSRGDVVPDRLLLVAERERVRPVLAELARQALRVEKHHPVWRVIADRLRREKPLRDTLLHWTRLAEPVMKDGRCNAERWRLVA